MTACDKGKGGENQGFEAQDRGSNSHSYHCSVTQSCPTLWPHGLQHARLACPSPTPGTYPDSCPTSQWCHPTISSSVIPFPFCLQSSPASRSFPMSQFFAPGGRSIGVSGGRCICVSSKRSIKRLWLCTTPTPDSLSVLVLGSICDPFLSDALLLEAQLWRSLPCISGPKVKVKVAQSCPTLCNPIECSLPGSSVHGILQTRIVEWVAISFSRGCS